MEDWAEQRGTADPLARTTVSDMLNGRRVPSERFLTAFLDVCGVIGEDAQRPWLAARTRAQARLERDRAEYAARSGPQVEPNSDERPQHAAPAQALAGGQLAGTTDTSPAGGRTAGLLWLAAGAAVVAVVTAAVTTPSRPEPSGPPTATIACALPSCAADGPQLAVSGRFTGQLPPGEEVHILIRVESTKRWYLGPAVTPLPDGTWQQRIGVGNPVAQAKDRLFTICVTLLPAAAMEGLVRTQEAAGGAGVPVEDMPAGRTELICTAATRPAGI